MSQLTNIYVLKLKNKKYYVGQSQNVNQRIKQHERGEGSVWTQKHKPVEVVEVRKNVSAFDEDKITKEYMAKYGVENVRGGSYSQIQLSDKQEEIVTREIDTATGACFRCGEKGHFANRCDAESCSEEDGSEDDDSEEDSDEFYSDDDY
jgi:predicted GIY-YIG superfamily endonuclease